MKLHWILLSAWAPGLWAADPIRPEVHAFTSFGWLDTTDNNWLGQSQGGTTEFWEAAANASIQPLPSITLSGQLFARDFQRYDNGRAQLDWLYGEWRPRDSFGLQVGRVKYPFGLYNEIRDVDAARATVFLPLSVYPLRARDLYNSTDGGKIFGLLRLEDAGSLEYETFGGHTNLSESGGFATLLTESGFGKLSRIDLEATYGAMLHWHLPFEGFGARVTVVRFHRLVYEIETATTRISTVADQTTFVSSLIYDHGQLTTAAEASLIKNSTNAEISSLSSNVKISEFQRDDRIGAAYLSATWHLPKDIDITAGCERLWLDYHRLGTPQTTRGVLAVRWGITDHWSVKAEYQRIVGSAGATRADNPDGIVTPWNLLALKTTFDF